MDELRHQWQNVDTLGTAPSVRYGSASMVYNNHLWVFGGAGAGVGKSSEVWKFSLSENRWYSVVSIGDIPTSRDGHSVTYIGDGKVLMFAGQGFSSPNTKLMKLMDTNRSKSYTIREVFNDIYQFDMNRSVWTRVGVDGTFFPPGRRSHSTVYSGDIPSLSKNQQSVSDGMRTDAISNKSLIVFAGNYIFLFVYLFFNFLI